MFNHHISYHAAVLLKNKCTINNSKENCFLFADKTEVVLAVIGFCKSLVCMAFHACKLVAFVME